MRGRTAALLIAPLLLASFAAMAQSTDTTRTNPFGAGPEAAPTEPATLPQQPLAPRAPRPQAARPIGANQYPSEDAAQQACGTDTVVWVNTGGRSRAWHVSGDRYYGHTKRGAYMCEQAALGAGYHASGRAAARARRAAGPTH